VHLFFMSEKMLEEWTENLGFGEKKKEKKVGNKF
jgi:hypothetical protein